jgi:Uma2 family endonuclease
MTREPKGAAMMAVKAKEMSPFPPLDLPTEDGEPLESSWHRAEINLLIESLKGHWRGRQDYYTGGNMFIYYTFAQARAPKYRGPDFYVVLNMNGSYARGAWVVWEEGGRYPDVIVELLSPSTAREDLTTKKDLYEQVFRTPEYYCYDPDGQELQGW